MSIKYKFMLFSIISVAVSLIIALFLTLYLVERDSERKIELDLSHRTETIKKTLLEFRVQRILPSTVIFFTAEVMC